MPYDLRSKVALCIRPVNGERCESNVEQKKDTHEDSFVLCMIHMSNGYA